MTPVRIPAVPCPSVLVRVRPCLLVAALLLVSAAALAANVPYAESNGEEDMKAPAVKKDCLRNGSFEQGTWWPANWDPMDKLGTMWVSGGTDGRKCLRVDTNLMEPQWLEWNEKVLALGKQAAVEGKGDPQSLKTDPIPAPPARQPTKPPYYDTVGGNHGIHYRSDFFRIEPGAIYRFTIDARTECGGVPMVFVKGFVDRPTQTDKGMEVLKRNAFRADLRLHKCSKEWQRYVRIVRPAKSTSTEADKALGIEWLQVQIYAYWPAGVYEFDNAKLEIIGYESTARPEKDSPKAPATVPLKPGKDDDIPMIDR